MAEDPGGSLESPPCPPHDETDHALLDDVQKHVFNCEWCQKHFETKYPCGQEPPVAEPT